MTYAIRNRTLQQHVTGAYLLHNSIAFGAYLIAGKIGQATANIRSSNLGPVWPAFGIALAALLIYGYRVWPGIAAATITVAYFSPVSHVTAVGQAAGSTLAAVIGALLLQRVLNFDPLLSRLSDALSLVAIGGFGSALVSSSIGVLVLYISDVHPYSGMGASWLIYWLGDATGVLLVTPIALRLSDFSKVFDQNRFAELVVLFLLLASASLIIFSNMPSIPIKLDVMAFAVLPFVIWAALRFGVAVTGLSVLMVASIATVKTALGVGPFASNTVFLNAVLLDVFFGVLSVTGLTLATVIAEREKAEQQREQAVIQQAALEAQLRTDDAIRESEERLRLATQAGNMCAYDWDVETDEIVEFGELRSIPSESANRLTRKQLLAQVHPEDQTKFIAADSLTPQKPTSRVVYRVLDHDDVRWFEKRARGTFNSRGEMLRVTGMVVDITERKRAEERLQEYEKAVEGAEEMIVVVDRQYRYCIANRQFLKLGKKTKEEVIGQTVSEVIGKEVFGSVVKPKLDECFQGQVTRYEMKFSYPELGERDIYISYFPIEVGEKVDRVACIVQDITDRKRSEEILAGMNRKLIQAQEQERTRIARELHDDVVQRLALSVVELGQMQQSISQVSPETGQQLAALRRRITELSSYVQTMSHELHSSKLEYLGLVVAMRGFCREFGEQQKHQVNFITRNVPTELPSDISLCLFRVLQEALHNAAKHSGATCFEVQLLGEPDGVHLTVQDSGAGFDLSVATQGSGIGLTSMQERVRLVNGTFAVESKPMNGTTIHVCVPAKLKKYPESQAS